MPANKGAIGMNALERLLIKRKDKAISFKAKFDKLAEDALQGMLDAVSKTGGHHRGRASTTNKKARSGEYGAGHFFLSSFIIIYN